MYARIFMHALLCIEETQGANVADDVYIIAYIHIYLYVLLYSCMHCVYREEPQGANATDDVYLNTHIYIYMYVLVYSCMHCCIYRKRRERMSLLVCT